jgi:hypothetical protein
MILKGLAIPIAFNYQYRGMRYGEAQIYFANQPISVGEIDLIEPGRKHFKEMKHLIKHGVQGAFDYLLPLAPQGIDREEVIPKDINPSFFFDMRYAIPRLNNNPTTATLFDRIELLPCKENNFKTMMGLLENPLFYLSKKDLCFSIHINDGNANYIEIPSHGYCPRCWHGYAHSVITTVHERGGCMMIKKYAELNWPEMVRQITKNGQ